MTDEMDLDTPNQPTQTPQITSTTSPSQPPQPPLTKKKPTPSSTRELTTLTIKSPPFTYIHLATPSTSSPTPTEIDPLQIRSYCTAALRQFLGETGSSILPDILLIKKNDIFLRLPREDLVAFSAAITAFGGDGKSSLLLRVVACGDWLGSLIGKGEEGEIWVG